MIGAGLTLAYHGCDISVRDDLVAGRLKHLTPSSNPYDWLGRGVYFFEQDARRALLLATNAAEHPELLLTRRPIATPAVVGVVLRVGTWLDMTTQDGLDQFQAGLEALTAALKPGEPLPVNQASFEGDEDLLQRQLDRAVFDQIHRIRALTPEDTPKIEAVRGAFPQGKQMAPTSAFRRQSHIQIALLEENCVVGWFLPPGSQLLTEKALEGARQMRAALEQGVTANKKRVRVTPKR